PLLVTVIVYTVLAPALTLATPSVLMIARSAATGAGITASMSVALLLPGVGSLAPAGGAMVTVLVTVPLAAVTVAVTVIWYVAPLASNGRANVPLSSSTTVGAVTQAPGVAEQATAVLLKPAAIGSARIAPVMLDGP